MICIQSKKGVDAKVIRINFQKEIIWETQIPISKIKYRDLVRMTAENEWKPEPIPSFTPRTWVCLSRNEIIIYKDRILVSYFDMPRTGIGISYSINLGNGKILWSTSPLSHQSICYLKDGLILIGEQGYGAFSTKLYARDGNVLQHWKSVGEMVVSQDDKIRLVEMDNHSDSELYLSELQSENIVKKGPRILGYYIVHPAIDEYGNSIFWRNNELVIIDKKMNKYSIMQKEPEERHTESNRILLFRKGEIIFSIYDRIYVIKTNLGRLADSTWPCKFGNLERNPVIV